MVNFNMHLPFLSKYKIIETDDTDYVVLDEDGYKIGFFNLLFNGSTYVAKVRLNDNLKDDLYVEANGVQLEGKFIVENLQFYITKPSYEGLIYQIKHLIY